MKYLRDRWQGTTAAERHSWLVTDEHSDCGEEHLRCKLAPAFTLILPKSKCGDIKVRYKRKGRGRSSRPDQLV